MGWLRNTLRNGGSLLVLAAPLAFLAAGAQASLVVSTAATANVTCSGGVCHATARNASLNVTDLENLLASSSVKLRSTGKAKDIVVAASLSWAASTDLTLDAFHSITIDKHVSDAGSGGLTLITDDGGSGGDLSFGAKGHVTFPGLSNNLTINGTAYTLVNTIALLASDIAANPSGFYALAGSYDASQDGPYASAPIPTVLTGTFEGLGNIVSHLTINDPTQSTGADGFFYEIGGPGGAVRDFGLVSASVTSVGDGAYVGTLTANNGGTIWRCWATGTVTANIQSFAAGLVAGNFGGPISQSYAGVVVSCGNACSVGGLVAINGNTGAIISQSYATGSVSTAGYFAFAGGLVGRTGLNSNISQSYATGAVTLTNATYVNSDIGGLVGANGYPSGTATISQSYSTGAVSAPDPTCSGGNCVGGMIGYDYSGDTVTSSYWDTTTSGITDLSQGAGNVPNDPGIAGLTTTQFQSGLPAGFDPSVWREKHAINGGLPYLRALP